MIFQANAAPIGKGHPIGGLLAVFAELTLPEACPAGVTGRGEIDGWLSL
jgi:hypothetical protein